LLANRTSPGTISYARTARMIKVISALDSRQISTKRAALHQSGPISHGDFVLTIIVTV